MESANTALTHAPSLARCNQATRISFTALYDAYFSRVYNYVRYRCTDADTADDLTAIIFEKALLHFHRYQPDRAPFGAWLFSIARNIVNEHLRGIRNHKSSSIEVLVNQPTLDELPETNLISAETARELLMALNTLDERERDLISLKFAARLTNRRIAEISGLSETNVGVILYRSLKKLRAQLETRDTYHGSS